MKYVIDTDVCIREQVSLPIVLYTMLVQSGTNLEEVKKDALQKEVVVERGEELLVQRHGPIKLLEFFYFQIRKYLKKID